MVVQLLGSCVIPTQRWLPGPSAVFVWPNDTELSSPRRRQLLGHFRQARAHGRRGTWGCTRGCTRGASEGTRLDCPEKPSSDPPACRRRRREHHRELGVDHQSSAIINQYHTDSHLLHLLGLHATETSGQEELLDREASELWN